MNTYVWVDAWQQQCCGDEFRVGSDVEWNVVLQDGGSEWVTLLLGAQWGARVAFSENHHGHVREATTRISGRVKSIRVVTCDRVRGPDPYLGEAMVPVPGSGRLSDADVADPWHPKSNLEPGTSFDGWIVELAVTSGVSMVETTTTTPGVED